MFHDAKVTDISYQIQSQSSGTVPRVMDAVTLDWVAVLSATARANESLLVLEPETSHKPSPPAPGVPLRYQGAKRSASPMLTVRRLR